MGATDETAEIILLEQSLNRWGYESPYLIGQGAFARVYRVREKGTGNFFACKISGEKQMLQREALLLRQIEHPLFPTFHQIREQGEMAFLFMEYVAGVNLETLIQRRGRMCERQAVRIGMELAQGLCFLHRQHEPILFRDVKPGNIVIGQDGKVKLLDFGSAGRERGMDCVITGTRGYAAPEQWENPQKVGPYSDVYGVGAVMYYVLTGMTPSFSRGEKPEYVKRQSRKNRSRKMTMPGKVHRGVTQLIADCMRDGIEDRIPDMRLLLQRLHPYQRENRWEILWLEAGTRFRKREENGYLFQKNLLKTSKKCCRTYDV